MIEFTAEETEFRKSVERFALKEIAPIAAEIDEREESPADLFRRMGEMGYFGLRYPADVGGAGAGFVTYLILSEELARASLSVAAAVAMQGLMGTDLVHRYATVEERDRLLIPALRGEKVGAFCLSEPDAGSDLARIQTTAREESGQWRLTGRKMWVTNGTRADFYTVAASVNRSQGLKGLRFFLVERGAPGLLVGKSIRKLGLRGSETTELALENVSATRLGDAGVEQLGRTLDQVRTMTGALALGVGRAALDEAIRYAGQRVCFGQPIAKFQAIQHKVAEAATDLEAARLLVYQAGRRIERGAKASFESAAAKLFASEAANRIADEASRILAGYGFAMEYPVQRYLRDARFLLIGGGTSEILKNLIAREAFHA